MLVVGMEFGDGGNGIWSFWSEGTARAAAFVHSGSSSNNALNGSLKPGSRSPPSSSSPS